MEQKKRSLRNDLLLMGILLLVAVVGGLALWLFGKTGDVVEVTVDGAPYATFSLAEDRVEEIRTGTDGAGLNLLVIQGGKASVQEASCPDGICSAHRPISKVGESIVCLPNRVVIAVQGEATEDAPDLVA